MWSMSSESFPRAAMVNIWREGDKGGCVRLRVASEKAWIAVLEVKAIAEKSLIRLEGGER